MIKNNKLKDQHYVPCSYLKSWIDSSTPPKQAGYVWTFPREDRKGRKKAPHNILMKNNIYTMLDPDGNRDLSIEERLCKLENDFAVVHRNLLVKRNPLPPEDLIKLMRFVATLQSRTPLMHEHFEAQCQNEIEVMEQMERRVAGMSPKVRENFIMLSQPPSSFSNQVSMDIEGVKKAKDKIPECLISASLSFAPVLAQMSIKILCTNSKVGFITSDNPVVWFNPKESKPSLYSLGLLTPTIEITMPISPKQMLLISHHSEEYYQDDKSVDYIDVSEDIVHELNRRTRGHCKTTFIVNQDYTNPHWFEC